MCTERTRANIISAMRMMIARILLLSALASSACGLRVAPALRGAARGKAPAATMQLWAGKKKSRYEDDGSRLQGASTIDNVDDKLKGGWFSNFKFGTEVEVAVPKDAKKKKGATRGMAADNSARGGGGGAFRNSESARFGGHLC